jgi:UV DNA damage endonuclease
MFPLADHIDFKDTFDSFCEKQQEWNQVKDAVKDYLSNDGRVSTHPDQFCIISSFRHDVNANGIRNLEYHAKMFDMLDIPKSHFCPINIHVSNGNNSDIAIQQVNHNLTRLSDSVLKRIVFETEDKSFWTYQNLYKHFPNIPITLDYHHRSINNEGESEETAHEVCVGTWKDIKPLFHYSEGKEHSLDRAHSDYISKLPKCAINVDLEIEAKQKDLAVLRYYENDIV